MIEPTRVGPASGPLPGGSRALLDQLRRLAVHLETAQILELRADRSPNPTLAAVLRERAGERREAAERLRVMLAVQGVVHLRRRSPR